MAGGGFTLVGAPPASATYGWFGTGYSAPTAPIGGGAVYSGVQRIDYSNDLTTASVRGPLTVNVYQAAVTGNADYGWFGGGYLSPGNKSTVSRMTYTTDTATGSTRGPLSTARSALGATGTSSYGWFAGGNIGFGITLIDRITYATDTATASIRGSLLTTNPATITGRFGVMGVTDKTTYGWFAGGGPADGGMVNRVTYATDTATAPFRGPLLYGNQFGSGSCNNNYGWVAGGAGNGSIVQRITYATDTATASARGPLSHNAGYIAANGNDSYGWFGGGYVPGTLFSQVSRIDYSNDTATASNRGALATYIGFSAGTQNTVYA
jgi:hypothetical protein